jgi:beta-lactamase regulating signal transducer with metallopeptidase domain
VRNAGATLEDNTVRDVSNHGVTLVGDASDVAVTSNTISGHGSVPIFDEDSEGATVQHNDTVDWRPALTMATVVNAIFQPLTIVWILLGLVVLATAVFARTRRRAEAIRHPYADRVPITAFTKGFVSRESMK